MRDQLSAADRDRLAGQLGEIIAALRQLPPIGDPGLAACGLASFGGWAARGVSANSAPWVAALWADQIPRFPGGAGLLSRPPVLLHTEVMRRHLLTADGPDGAWRLSGLTGFEPAMREGARARVRRHRGVRRRR